MKYVYRFSKELFACGIPFLKKHLMTSCRVVLGHSSRWDRLAPSQLWWLCCYPWSWILRGWGPLIEGCRISVKWEWWSQQEWGKFLLPRVSWIFTASFMAIHFESYLQLGWQTRLNDFMGLIQPTGQTFLTPAEVGFWNAVVHCQTFVLIGCSVALSNRIGKSWSQIILCCHLRDFFPLLLK